MSEAPRSIARVNSWRTMLTVPSETRWPPRSNPLPSERLSIPSNERTCGSPISGCGSRPVLAWGGPHPPPQLLFGDELQSDDRFPERLLPAPLLGESRRELLGGERVRLHQELAQLRAAPVALENRHELAPRQYFLRDEDVAERHVGFRLALHA